MSAAVAPLAVQRKRRARIALAIVVLLVIAAIAAVVPVVLKSTRSSTVAPATVTAETRTITQVVSGSGSTVAANSVTVNPEVSGTITKLYVSLGDEVQEGDKLYRVSSDDADNALLKARSSLLQAKQSKMQAASQLTQAKSQLYSAKTQKIQAQQSLDRLQSKPATSTEATDEIVIAKRQLTSAKKGVSAAQDGVDSARVGVQVASANYTAAQRSYNDAADDVDKTVVTALIDGTITALPVSEGDFVSAGTSSSSSSGSSLAGGDTSTGGSTSGSSGSSIVIADLTNLAVTVNVSEVDVPDLSVGMEATVTIDALSGEAFIGAVKSISPNGTTSSGVVNYAVEISLEDGDERLRPDMTATTDIVTRTATGAVAIPNSAIKSDGTTKYVQVSSGETDSVRRTVHVGVSDDTFTEITSGLKAGEKVLTASATSSSNASEEGFRGGMMMGGPPAGAARGGN
jgi:macrolide-specific efflux system membrane fusion protein